MADDRPPAVDPADGDLPFEAWPAEWRERLEREKLAALAEFAAAAGHEINNPLAVIAGRAQRLLADEADPERRRELASIETQAWRIHEMIAGLMLFARPPEPVLQPLDMESWLTSLLAEYRGEPRAAGVEIVATLGSLSGPIEADPVQLRVALRALLDNACHALAGEGRIELELAERAPSAGSVVELRVADSGPGISPAVRRHLFDPFFSGASAGRGLGIGLSKCWRIVTLHGGTIDVVPGLASTGGGVGAAFILHLPRRGSGRQQGE